MAYNAQDLLVRVPILREYQSFAKSIAADLHAVIHFEGECVAPSNVIGHEMWFVYSGILHVKSDFRVGKTSGAVLTTLSTGCYFGECSLLFQQRRLASIFALGTCILFQLSKEALFQGLDDFPDVRKRFEDAARLRRARMLLMDPDKGKGITLTRSMLFDEEDRDAAALRVTVRANHRLSI